MELEIYDLECFPNFFSYTGFRRATEKITQIYIYDKDTLKDLYEYLWGSKIDYLVGFNNLNFDYPLLHYIKVNYEKLNKLTPEEQANKLYVEAQRIIATEFSAVRKKDVTIPQIDLYRIHHFDNKAKITSLKDIEIVLKFPVVEDMPFKHDHVVDDQDVDKILAYNLNDVMATNAFYEKSRDRIKMRSSLGKEFGLDLLNANDPKIGQEIFMSLISQESKVDINKLRGMRTPRDTISLVDCVLPGIKFKDKGFNTLLETIKGTVLTETKGSMEYSVTYKGFKYDFGLGGIHGCIDPGVYEATEDQVIYDIDVTSFYPNLSIVYGFRPEHLGNSFNTVYKSIFEKRAAAKKIGNKVVNEGLKLALNGVFGKSNSEWSPFYDPKFTMQITINGQLLIAVLAKSLADIGCTILQANTDGITISCSNKELEKVKAACQSWETQTKLQLEYKHYKKMVIRDVNNYLAVDVDGNVKYKGCFEIDKEYHKDPSFRIVPIALSKYFVEGVPIEETIKTHNNIYDFCGRFKARGEAYGEIRYFLDGREVKEKLQKTNRYFISNKGKAFFKIYGDGREEMIEKGWLVSIFNRFEQKDNYDLNHKFYIAQCKRIIDAVQTKQWTLF
jgi:hypothetical protein